MNSIFFNFLKKTLQNTIEFIFPSICTNCKSNLSNEEIIICKKCLSSDFIGKSINSNSANIYQIFYMYEYSGIIQKMILKAKRENNRKIFKYLISLLQNSSKRKFLKTLDIQLVSPVPTLFSKKLQTGYNQAEIISQQLSKILNINYSNKYLKKIKKNLPQKSLGKFERIKNVRNVFKLTKSPKIKNILLVDDVLTTGATINECANLFSSENIKVNIFALAINKSFNFNTLLGKNNP